jgi:hypothetical protein
MADLKPRLECVHFADGSQCILGTPSAESIGAP